MWGGLSSEKFFWNPYIDTKKCEGRKYPYNNEKPLNMSWFSDRFAPICKFCPWETSWVQGETASAIAENFYKDMLPN